MGIGRPIQREDRYGGNDYLMRQIEDMTRFLGKVMLIKTEDTIPLFHEQGNVLESGLLYKRLCAMLEEGDANSAENLLFDEVEAHPDPAYLQVAVQFYADLQHWTDAALEAADFSVRSFWTALQP